MKITGTNLFALAQHFGALDVTTNLVHSTSAQMLRRCIKAGLVVVDRDTLRLTADGRAMLREASVKDSVIGEFLAGTRAARGFAPRGGDK